VPFPERETKVENEELRTSISFAVHHPLDEAYFPFVKFYHFFRSDADALGWINSWSADPRPVLLSPAVKDAWSRLANVYYIPLMIIAGLGIPLWFSVKDKRKLILIFFVGAWVGTHLMLWPSGRYHVALTPIFSLWAAVAIIAAYDMIEARRGLAASIGRRQ
jgi:hypothetical protein